MSPTDADARPSAHSPSPPARPHAPGVVAHEDDDEIDLFELAAGLWRRRWLIAQITGGVAVAGVVYALWFTTPLYEATAIVRPSSMATLAMINEARIVRSPETETSFDARQLFELTPEDAFSDVVFEARSRETQWEVFLAHKAGLFKEWPSDEVSDATVFLTSFVPKIGISIEGMGKNDVMTQSKMRLGFMHPDPAYSATVANALVDAASSRARNAILTEFRSTLVTRIDVLSSSLKQVEVTLKEDDQDRILRLEEDDRLKRLQIQDQLDALTRKAETLRRDRIVRLREALSIADSMGIEDPTSLEMLAHSQAGRGELLSLSANLKFGAEPEYLKGTRLLAAELRALEARESEVYFYPEIRDLEEQLALLEHNREVEILKARENYLAFADGVAEARSTIAELQGYLAKDYSDVQLVQIEQRAIPPRSPSKPNRKQIVIIATVAGGMLGVLLALILNAVDNRRRDQGDYK